MQSHVRRARRLHPLPRLHRNRACPISASKIRSKSDKSDFDWRVGEGEAACSVLAASPSPPSPASGGGSAGAVLTSHAIARPALQGRAKTGGSPLSHLS